MTIYTQFQSRPTLVSNPRPEWFGIHDAWLNRLRHPEDMFYKAAEERFQCKNKQTKYMLTRLAC